MTLVDSIAQVGYFNERYPGAVCTFRVNGIPSLSAKESNGTYFKVVGFTIVPAQDSSTELSRISFNMDITAGSRNEEAQVEVDGR
jgi:hypothetical protein